MLTNSIIKQKFKLLTTSSSIHSRLGGEVAKTRYILLYRASRLLLATKVLITAQIQPAPLRHISESTEFIGRTIDCLPLVKLTLPRISRVIATISLDQRTRCIMGLLFASHAIVLQRFRVNITPNRLLL